MPTIPIAILGAPFAAWAMYGCLAILGVTAPVSATLAALWSVAWLAIAHRAPASKLFRRRRAGARGGRGAWSGALLCSFFLPVPVYALAVLLEWLQLASATVTLPVLTMLALPLPAALWWMLLWPSSTDVEGEIIHPLGWRRYTPHAPSGVIPPTK